MHFRLTYSVTPLLIQLDKFGGGPITFNYGGPHTINVIVRAAPEAQNSTGTSSYDAAHCTAQSEFDPSNVIAQMFQDLRDLRLPEGSRPREGAYYLESDGTIKPHYILPLTDLPQPFQDFVVQVRKELGDHLTRTVKVLRWRHFELGPPNPFAVVRHEWSFDGKEWQPMPTRTTVRVRDTRLMRPSQETRASVEELVAKGWTEPVGHELLREARTLGQDTPRSSLVIAIAAAEVGFKELVADLVPEAGWLVENVPSPPLIRMLQEYLPKLPARKVFKGKVVAPPKRVMDAVGRGVQWRNDIVHRGAVTFDDDDLDFLLDAVRDLLFLLDYYRGREWSLEHITAETLRELGIRPDQPN